MPCSQKTKDFISRFPIALYCSMFDQGHNFAWMSSGFTAITGHETGILSQVNFFINMVHEEDIVKTIQSIKNQIESSGRFNAMYRLRHDNGEYIWVQDKGHVVEDEKSGPMVYGSLQNISNHKRKELLLTIISELTNTVNTATCMDQMYLDIHKILKKHMSVENFFVAQLEGDEITFPYSFDQKKHPKTIPDVSAPATKSLTLEVIKSGKPQMFSKEEITEGMEAGDLVCLGPVPEMWIGVPMIVMDEVVGAIVVQSYTDKNFFSSSEAEVLSAVASQIALASENKKAEIELMASREQFKTLVESISDVIFTLDVDRKVSYISPVIRRTTGFSPKAVTGEELTLFLHPADMAAFDSWLDLSTETDAGPLEFRFLGKNRQTVHLRGSVSCPEHMPSDAVVFGVLTDITERKMAQEALELSEKKYKSIFFNAIEGLYQVDTDNRFISANPSCAGIFGFESPEDMLSEVKNMNAELFEDPEQRALLLSPLLERRQRTVENLELRAKKKDGSVIWVEESVRAEIDSTGEVKFLEGSLQDITKRKKAEEQLSLHNLHDGLTGLPNRFLFMDHLSMAHTRRVTGSGPDFSVMMIDLDRFKIINDSFGHQAGDQLLQEISSRLLSCLSPTDTLARLGGDEFVILMDSFATRKKAQAFAGNIFQALSPPIRIQGHEVYTSACIGAVLSGGKYSGPDNLMRDVDAATYTAKEKGPGTFEVFTPSMQEGALNRLTMETDLRKAIQDKLLYVHFQPIVDLGTGSILGFEALSRWTHPERGIIGPDTFIPLAEETGMIIPLGRLVLNASLEALAGWKKDMALAGNNPEELFISVNFSAQQLLEEDMVELVVAGLRQWDIHPESLKIEITESVFINNPGLVLAKLTALRNLGVRISVDDFGTGFSSLSYLQRFPVDELKMDRAFVHKIDQSPDARKLAYAILALAKALDLGVVAEGIERKKQADLLMAKGCEYGQGFYFARPSPKDRAGTLLGLGRTFSQSAKNNSHR